MATIAENLQIIKDSTDAIKQAIIDKGGNITGDITTWGSVISGLGGNSEIGSVIKIKNKLNGATIGDGKFYSTETLLYEYEVETENNDDIIKPLVAALGFNAQSLSGYVYEGITPVSFQKLKISGDGDLSAYVFLSTTSNLGNLFYPNSIEKLQISISSEWADSPSSNLELIPICLVVYDSEFNFDIDFFYISYTQGSCFLSDTQISLSNGLTKLVQDITYNDELLVWNFDEGKFDKAKPLWIKKKETTHYYYKIFLENGTSINLVGSNGKCHRLFNYSDQIFESATDLMGKEIYTLNGLSKVILIEKVEEVCEYYNIITEYHMNLFANGILTSCRYNNLYPIKDMMFDKSEIILEPRYSIHEKFREHPNILPKYIIGMRLDEIRDPNFEEIDNYISNLENRRKRIDDFEENKIILNDIEKTNVGWISPTGEVFGYKTYMSKQQCHETIAKSIFPELKQDRVLEKSYSQNLEALGWVKYTNTYLSSFNENEITDNQGRELTKFIENNDIIKSRGSLKLGSVFSEDIFLDKIKTMEKETLLSKINLYYGSRNKKNKDTKFINY